MGDGVRFPDVLEELVAQPFAVRGTGYQPRDIHELHGRWHQLVRFHDIDELLQPWIRHGNDANIGIDGAERIVFRGDFATRQGIEER